MATTLNEGTSGDLNRYVIVGGGIAGVSCAEEVINSNLPHACIYYYVQMYFMNLLCITQLHQLDPAAEIHVISSSSLIKAVTNFRQVSYQWTCPCGMHIAPPVACSCTLLRASKTSLQTKHKLVCSLCVENIKKV